MDNILEEKTSFVYLESMKASGNGETDEDNKL